jgi:prophage maintenance system killer protein
VVTALVFLDLNGIEIDAPRGRLYDLTLSVAIGQSGNPYFSHILNLADFWGVNE